MGKKLHPSILVFTTVFPNSNQPYAGIFIRERMFRVGYFLPMLIVAPIPWFPLQGLIRLFRPHFRPSAPYHEVQQYFEVYHPRFFSVPGIFKAWDGFFMAVGCYRLISRLKHQGKADIIDAHFAYPDGYAATLLAKWLKLPVTITLRGTEKRLTTNLARRRQILQALETSDRVFSVAESLRRHMIEIGASGENIKVVNNGVDTSKFMAIPQEKARAALGLPMDTPILITVGGLVERKGFHRVIECLPELRRQYRGLQYLIVGGSSAEGNWRAHLDALVVKLGLQDSVKFLGAIPPEELRIPLSAADVFVLASSNEGWANVLLEAMACGLPVVATDVGGNSEVICDNRLGILVPFNDGRSLQNAISAALSKEWDHSSIVEYARNNNWEKQISVLVKEFENIYDRSVNAIHV
jgi:glycosyltransferase involved in cell wall biosynthesis